MSNCNIEKYDFETFEKEHLPFTMIPNQVIQQAPQKHLKAIFIWIYFQSLPPNWSINKYHIMKHFSLSARTYERYMSYLNAAKLIEYRQDRQENGSFGQWRLIILSGTKFIPLPENTRSAKIGGVEVHRSAILPLNGEAEATGCDAHINTLQNTNTRFININTGMSGCIFTDLNHVINNISEHDCNDAGSYHVSIARNLIELGYKVAYECAVKERGDGKSGRIDLAIFTGEKMIAAIEIDRASPRRKSIHKLNTLDCEKFIILREPKKVIKVTETSFSSIEDDQDSVNRDFLITSNDEKNYNTLSYNHEDDQEDPISSVEVFQKKWGKTLDRGKDYNYGTIQVNYPSDLKLETIYQEPDTNKPHNEKTSIKPLFGPPFPKAESDIGKLPSELAREEEENKGIGYPATKKLTRLTQFLTKDQINTFEEFWQMYPMKKNKYLSMVAWFENGCHKIAQEITKKLDEQIKNDKHFQSDMIPNPENYIKGLRWLDEIYKPKNSRHLDFKSQDWSHHKSDNIFDNL